MTDKEIQEAADKYADRWKQYPSNHFEWISKAYADGVKSDTAARHHAKKWVQVTEQYPEHREKVLTHDHLKNVDCLVFIKAPLMEANYFEYEEGGRNYNITKWQPMPEPDNF
jgi:hypothetical protein